MAVRTQGSVLSLNAGEFVQENERVGKKRICRVHLILETLDDEDRDVFEAQLVTDPLLISAGAIANVMTKHGHQLSFQMVQAHRAESCSCFK